jgi:hypothetical protein
VEMTLRGWVGSLLENPAGCIRRHLLRLKGLGGVV